MKITIGFNHCYIIYEDKQWIVCHNKKELKQELKKIINKNKKEIKIIKDYIRRSK